MKILPLFFGFTLFTSVIFPTAVLAHDDGLTCHEHPTPIYFPMNFEEIKVVYTETESGIDLDRLIHRFDNSINQQPQAYVTEDVHKLRRAFSEIREAIGLVAGLVARAGRSGPKDTRQIQSLSFDLYSALRLDKLISYDAIVNGIRTKQPIVLDAQNLMSYLIRERDVPDNIIIILDQAAQACG